MDDLAQLMSDAEAAEDSLKGISDHFYLNRGNSHSNVDGAEFALIQSNQAEIASALLVILKFIKRGVSHVDNGR